MGRIVPGNETSEGETPRFQGRTYRKVSFTCSGLQPSEKGASIFLPERSLVSFPGQIPYLVTHSPTELGSRAECIRPSGTGECPVVAKHSQNSSLGDLQQPWPQVCSEVTKPQVAQPWDISTFGRVFSHPLASLMPPQSYSHWPDPEPSDSSPKNCDNPPTPPHHVPLSMRREFRNCSGCCTGSGLCNNFQHIFLHSPCLKCRAWLRPAW